MDIEMRNKSGKIILNVAEFLSAAHLMLLGVGIELVTKHGFLLGPTISNITTRGWQVESFKELCGLCLIHLLITLKALTVKDEFSLTIN